MGREEQSGKRGPKARRGERKDRILDAAQRVFGADGFIAASTQRIADEAGVDKKLLHYYFGTKDDLFIAMLQRAFAAIDGKQVITAALHGEGSDALARYVKAVLHLYEDPEVGPAFIAVLRSIGSYQPAATAFRKFLNTTVLPLTEDTSLPDAHLRLPVMGSGLFGFLTVRYVLKIPAIANLDIDAATALIVPSLSCALDPSATGASAYGEQ